MLSWGMFQKAFIHHPSPQPHSWQLDVLPLLRDAAILRGGFWGSTLPDTPNPSTGTIWKEKTWGLLLSWMTGSGVAGERAEGNREVVFCPWMKSFL